MPTAVHMWGAIAFGFGVAMAIGAGLIRLGTLVERMNTMSVELAEIKRAVQTLREDVEEIKQTLARLETERAK